MRILVLSDHETHGGASVAMQRLLDGLSNEPVEVLHVACLVDHNVGCHRYPVARFFEPVHLTVAKRLGKKAGFNGPGSSIQTRLLKSHIENALRDFQPDVINIHNLHATGHGLEILEAIPERLPVVWTLHDMWSFTGRCAYSYGCEKFKGGCDASCPTATDYPALHPNRIGNAWKKKQGFTARSATTITVAPSKWLAKEAETGMWGPGRCFHIPYGIDLATYRPHSRQAARDILGIDQSEFVMLSAASNFNEQRKGGALLYETAKQLAVSGRLISMGNSDIRGRFGNLECTSSGFLSDEISKILHYCAADLLVHPALVDNLPNVVVEALACGLPAVALPIGGLPDMVVDGVTGWLAKDITANALIEAVSLAHSEKRDWDEYRVRARKHAEANYPLSLQATRYIALFEQAINHPRQNVFSERLLHDHQHC